MLKESIHLYAFWAIALIGIVVVFALLIKFPPIEKQHPITIKDEMSIRHIAERNDVPFSRLISALSPEDRKDFLTTFQSTHTPIRELDIDKDQIRSLILESRKQGFPGRYFFKFILWSVCIVGAGLVLFGKKNILRTRNIWLIAAFPANHCTLLWKIVQVVRASHIREYISSNSPRKNTAPVARDGNGWVSRRTPVCLSLSRAWLSISARG